MIDLSKLIEKETQKIYYTNFQDQVIEVKKMVRCSMCLAIAIQVDIANHPKVL